MLRQRQIEILERILNLNEARKEGDHHAALNWKTLVYDERGLAIISVLMKVSNLMDVGVTSYAMIGSKRSPIPDVSAVYLVEPIEANLRRIAQDTAAPLYKPIHINFTSPIQSELLEHLAALIAQQSDGTCISSIFDQYIDFLSPDPYLFALFEKDTVLTDIYSFHANDEAAEATINRIALCLVSVFLTAGEIPRILYPTKESASSLVASKFSELFKPLAKNFELWDSRRNPKAGSQKPLLILLDRTIDLAGPLHHPNTYEALIHDQFGIKRNQVTVSKPSTRGESTHDLDIGIDTLWKENKNQAFDTVATMLSKNVNQFTQEYGSIENDISGTIARLPELRHLKISLSAHTAICDALLECVRQRKAESLFITEEDLFTQCAFDFNKFIELVRSVPENSDKLRVSTIAYLCDAISPDEFDRLHEAVGSDISFLKSLDQFKIMTKAGKGYLNRVLKHVSGLGSQTDSNAVAEKLPVVETTRRLLNDSIEGFKIMNPTTGLAEKPDSVGNVYVFVVGPGSYVEYNGLINLGSKSKMEITYGCTSMLQPKVFMEQIMKMTQ